MSILLTNIQICGLLSWGWDRGSGGGHGYLESDFCWKIPYYIHSVCPHGQWRGGSAECGQVWTRGAASKVTENVRISFIDRP